MTNNKAQDKIIPGLIWMILWCLSWLPGFILQFLSQLVHAVAFLFIRYRWEVAESNIGRSFPEMKPEERQRVVDHFFRHFSELFLEMILLVRRWPTQSQKRIRFNDSKLIMDAFNQRKDIIVLQGHYGNWEWTVPLLLKTGYRVIGIYKPQSNPMADCLMRMIRQKPGLTLVPMKETFRALTSELGKSHEPFALFLIADQTPARVDIRFWTTFLHQETAFFTGAEKIANRFSLPVYYLEQEKKGFGRYSANLSLLHDGTSPNVVGDITKSFAIALEASIRKIPHLWLWTHRRWKYRREGLPLAS